MPEQVPEIQERIDRQRAERTSPQGTAETAHPATDGWTVRRWLWMLIAGSVAGFVILGVVQWWFLQRPGSTRLFSVLFPIAWLILSSLLVAGIVGLVVSIQLRREQHQTDRVLEMERLVHLHGEGLIEDEELAAALHTTVQPAGRHDVDSPPRTSDVL